MRRYRYLPLLILVCLLACSSLDLNKPTTTEKVENIKICAKVNSIGRIHPLQGTEGRMRWEINLTVIKNLNYLAPKAPGEGKKLQIFLHSPSRDFGYSPEESEGKNFLVTLDPQGDGWVILKSKKNADLCPDI